MDTGIKVGDCMKTNLVTISEGASVFEAARSMRQEGVGCLLVENEERQPSAILTDADIVRKCVAENRMKLAVKEIASKPLIAVDCNEDLSAAADLMGKKKVKRLVVTKGGKICGIISQSDIVKISPSLYELIAAKAGY